MIDVAAVEERLIHLINLEEECFIAGFHQNVGKQSKKAWHDRHIKNKQFSIGRLVLMYNCKFFKRPGKLKTHWLVPYVVKEINDGGEVKLEKLDGTEIRGIINGSQLKPYFDKYDYIYIYIYIYDDDDDANNDNNDN